METSDNKQSLRIGIIGGGFSGTSLAALLHQYADIPIEIVIFEKTGHFGAGHAYSTPFLFHLLNVRAADMSIFEDKPSHFVNWLQGNEIAKAHLEDLPYEDQFVPRFLYRHYLNDVIKELQAGTSKQFQFTLSTAEIIDAIPQETGINLILKEGFTLNVDKVILATGNEKPAGFPFPVSEVVNCIVNPWDYAAVKMIPSEDTVLIVGTGLSMIDTVLTLHHHGHQGDIYAVSRHGLLPLPHAPDSSRPYLLRHTNLPNSLAELTSCLRQLISMHADEGGDWRAVINALRSHAQLIWQQASLTDKKRFIRHVLPYWNIHRHRVHSKISDLLEQLTTQQLKVRAGKVIEIKEGSARIKLRHDNEVNIPLKWAVNCMGPSLFISSTDKLTDNLLKRRLASVDPTGLGFAVSQEGALKDAEGHESQHFFALGPAARAAFWECSAVPEIRKHSLKLAKLLLDKK